MGCKQLTLRSLTLARFARVRCGIALPAVATWLAGTCRLFGAMLVGLLELIDGAEDETDLDLPPFYNYRTSSLDPDKRLDGLYDPSHGSGE